MRTLLTVISTLLFVWAGLIGSLYTVERLGENLGYGVERMVLGDETEEDIEEFDSWLEARAERVDKAGEHLLRAGALTWIAPPGFRAEVRDLITEARALHADTKALLDQAQELDERHEAFSGVVGEPLFVEGRGLPDEQALLQQEALELTQDLEAIVELAQRWQELRQQTRELSARGEALQRRAHAERHALQPF